MAKRMPAYAALASALALGALVTGCGTTGGAMIYDFQLQPGYLANDIQTIPAMPLQIIGTPPDGADVAEVAAQMKLPPRFSSKPFVPATDLANGPRVVIDFGQTNNAGICKSEANGGPPAKDMDAMLAYCWGDRQLTSVMMSAPGVRGPSDSAFGPAMSQAIMQLLPSQPMGGDWADNVRHLP